MFPSYVSASSIPAIVSYKIRCKRYHSDDFLEVLSNIPGDAQDSDLLADLLLLLEVFSFSPGSYVRSHFASSIPDYNCEFESSNLYCCYASLRFLLNSVIENCSNAKEIIKVLDSHISQSAVRSTIFHLKLSSPALRLIK